MHDKRRTNFNLEKNVSPRKFTFTVNFDAKVVLAVAPRPVLQPIWYF